MVENETDEISVELSKAERQTAEWQYSFLDTTTIEAGEHIVPAKLSGNLAEEFADWHMIGTDLKFALDCLLAASALGNPDFQNTQSKALIFSAVVAYARPFKSGVRRIKMNPSYFSHRPTFNAETHTYLIAIRDKHVAHSVNDFERSDATGVMIGTPQSRWRPAGVGVTLFHAIGVSQRIVEQAIAQITDMLVVIEGHINRIKPDLFQTFCEGYERDKSWEIVPLARFPDRQDVQKRRS